jgi:hypothetical protein
MILPLLYLIGFICAMFSCVFWIVGTTLSWVSDRFVDLGNQIDYAVAELFNRYGAD